MDVPNWDELNNRQKLRIVSSDIQELISELISLTSAGGELDAALDESIASFEPLLQSLNIQEEDDIDVDDIDISLETIMRDVAAKQAEHYNEKRASKTSSRDGSTQSEISELSVGWSKMELLSKIETSEILSTSGTSETFKEPGPSQMRTRRSKTLSMGKESTESTYATLTHYEPVGTRNSLDKSGGSRRKSKSRQSRIY